MSDGRTPILYLAPWVDLGGSDRGTIDWFKNIDRSRWAPSLMTTTPSPNRWLHHVEPYAEEIWDLPDLMPGAAFPEFILGFIESRGVRVVHIMNSRLGYDLLPDMTCLPEPPAVVVQLHAEEPNQTGYVRYVTRRYGNLIDAFSVVSENLKQTIADYEIPASRIDVIYLGVDSEGEFDPARVEPLELPGNGAKRILWPGRLVEQKDPMLTLEVLARARERGAKFVLDVVGDGHLKEPAQARAEELGVGDTIQWHPPSQEMARWYRSSDLLLMTSVYEGIPLVIYEALAMSVPVVAPALPGNVEFMDADSGVLVEPRDDVDRYADAIVALLGDEERRREMGERSRRRMLEDFSLAEMGRRHDALYERLLSERPASSRWRNEELFGEEDPAHHRPDSSPPQPLRLSRDPSPERTVGVIVPCYRHGIFLDACIASIKAQTHPAAQIVVVDDGSEDPETIDALARLDDDPEVTVLRQPANAGPSAARNRALGQLDTSYFLPIDADDELLPDALERMLAQLESAPGEVGFVYPNAQHIGNQVNYVESPAYNLWLLMEQNYCPAPALFDRRLFEETGVAYPEEIVVGHEDWDLVLQLAERDVRGMPAEGPTFHYRKQGFSRVHAVDYGPDSFHKTIEGRHPHLYLNRDSIKAEWAPALSVVLLDEDEGAWELDDLSGLARQTCTDFEVVGRAALGAGARCVDSTASSPLEWLQDAIDDAQGRWVLLLPRSAAAALDAPSFVEQLVHAFVALEETVALVLADAPGLSRTAFAQLDDTERLSALPGAVVFERPLWGRAPEIPLGVEASPLADLVVGLRTIGPVQWRVAPVGGEGTPWLTYPPDGLGGLDALDINVPAPDDASEAAMRHMVAHQPPRLPEMTRDRVRRWKSLEPWTPPQTQVLCRHRDSRTGLRIVSASRKPPPEYKLEQVLGCTHLFPAPGMRRLIHANHSYGLSDSQDELPEGHFAMGYVEQQPLSLLQPLELRRVPDSGQEVLVAGADDPLVHDSELIENLGWIEACPILPRASDILHTGPWAVVSLRRQVDYATWRHSYRAEPPGEASEGVELGSLRRYPGPDLVALRLRPDGRLASELCAPGRASRDPRKIGRWLAEPLVADSQASMRMRGAASRLRHLARHYRARRLAEEEGVTLGYLPRQHMPGSSTLYSTIHPVTGDQLVTRVAHEATDAGYVMDGILGAIFDPPGDAPAPPEEMPWARVSRG
ncbi:MAG TPA: glycosyltransferase [Solirubrobacterales bacterium]